MDNYTLSELIWSLAVLAWPICLLLIVIILRKDISNLISRKYHDASPAINEGGELANKVDPVKVPSEQITSETAIEPQHDEKINIKDDSIDINVDICRNNRGVHFIVIKEISNDKAIMITPNGEKKSLELSLFSELEEKGLNELFKEKLITENQLLTYKKYIDDNATRAINAFLVNPMNVSTKEPAYVRSYREMLNKPNTIPSRMFNYIEGCRETTWADVKSILTDKYGYRDSGSYSASLRVLLIDGHINIRGKGDNKIITLSSTQ